jgi:hypothetical protein
MLRVEAALQQKVLSISKHAGSCSCLDAAGTVPDSIATSLTLPEVQAPVVRHLLLLAGLAALTAREAAHAQVQQQPSAVDLHTCCQAGKQTNRRA